MLIADEIQRLCDERQLFPNESLEWREQSVRRVHVSVEIHQFLTVKSRDRAMNRDRRRLQAFFDSFVAGELLTVTLEEDVMGTDMKRLSQGSEVWEVKLGEKSKQWRLFGRFAEPNHFIGLIGPMDRANLDYRSAIVRCQEKWRALFGKGSPVYGSKIDDYITAKGISLGNP